MKRIRKGASAADEPRSEYRLDYTKSRPNRFAPKAGGTRVAVTLEPDVARAFGSSRRVNEALRSVMRSAPRHAGVAVRRNTAKS